MSGVLRFRCFHRFEVSLRSGSGQILVDGVGSGWIAPSIKKSTIPAITFPILIYTEEGFSKIECAEESW